MKSFNTIFAAAVSAALLLPGVSRADLILDTGTPTGTSTYVLSTKSFLAAKFAGTAGQTITGLSAYLTQGAGTIGDQFDFDIYADSGFTNRPRPGPVFSTQGTFTGNGWNTTSVSWTPSSSGNYWLALQVSSTSQTRGLSLPGEASSTSGSVPALAFAYLGTGTNSQYTTSGAPAVGLQVSSVPLPAAAWLLGSGLLGMGATIRRKKETNGTTAASL